MKRSIDKWHLDIVDLYRLLERNKNKEEREREAEGEKEIIRFFTVFSNIWVVSCHQ